MLELSPECRAWHTARACGIIIIEGWNGRLYPSGPLGTEAIARELMLCDRALLHEWVAYGCRCQEDRGMVQVTFHGTDAEGNALVDALMHSCGCTFGLMGVRTSTCRAHDMLISDQRALDGLLFMRRLFALREPDAAQRTIGFNP